MIYEMQKYSNQKSGDRTVQDYGFVEYLGRNNYAPIVCYTNECLLHYATNLNTWW